MKNSPSFLSVADFPAFLDDGIEEDDDDEEDGILVDPGKTSDSSHIWART